MSMKQVSVSFVKLCRNKVVSLHSFALQVYLLVMRNHLILFLPLFIWTSTSHAQCELYLKNKVDGFTSQTFEIGAFQLCASLLDIWTSTFPTHFHRMMTSNQIKQIDKTELIQLTLHNMISPNQTQYNQPQPCFITIYSSLPLSQLKLRMSLAQLSLFNSKDSHT